MLAIRLQRTGRKGHAQYRVVVQESRLTPTSGRVVYRLGNYDPHAKVLNIDTAKADFYLEHGAQPSDRIARLFKNNGVKLPDWVSIAEPVKRTIKNTDKLRKHRPEEPKEEPKAEAPAEEPAEEVAVAEEAPAAEEPAVEEKPAAEAPAEDDKSEDADKKAA
jgi:small subunit ribosomal protein S16